MTRLILAASLALALVGCGSSDGGKKDAAPGTPDAGSTADGPGARDLGTADCGFDCSPQDLAGLDVPGPSLDAAADVVTDSFGPATDAPAEDAPPDVQPDLAADVGPDSSPDLAPDAVARCGHINCDCTFVKNGKTFKLSGKYRIDNIFPDFKVREVTFAEDLRVQKVTFLPDSCGKWQQDDIFPDFKIQIVTFAEDFSIRYVDFSPGLPP